jgi:hypothetical protein
MRIIHENNHEPHLLQGDDLLSAKDEYRALREIHARTSLGLVLPKFFRGFNFPRVAVSMYMAMDVYLKKLNI